MPLRWQAGSTAHAPDLHAMVSPTPCSNTLHLTCLLSTSTNSIFVDSVNLFSFCTHKKEFILSESSPPSIFLLWLSNITQYGLLILTTEIFNLLPIFSFSTCALRNYWSLVWMGRSLVWNAPSPNRSAHWHRCQSTLLQLVFANVVDIISGILHVFPDN
jgi:hypothetical protein